MVSAKASDFPWEVSDDGRATSLTVRLRHQQFVFPWSLFLFAEGNDSSVRVVFHTHVISVQGAGLTFLLSDLAAQVVSALIEPGRTAKFTASAGPSIAGLSVSENK